MSIIAAGVSGVAPEHGQSHRSGPNFQLLRDDNQFIQINCLAGVVFDIKQDKSLATDPTIVANATNGTALSGTDFKTGNNYYIANPKHASDTFVVILTQS